MESIIRTKISIIVPVYNVEKYLEECIGSILNQTFDDFEVLLINDSSTDHSRDICIEYAKKDERIRLLDNKENIGQALRRNQGINEAKGDYITFIDSDDFIDNNYLMTLLSAAENTNSEVVSMGHIEYIKKQESEQYYSSREINIVNNAVYITDDKKQRMELMCNWSLILVPWGKLYKRDFLLSYRLRFEDIISEDILFGFAVLYAADRYLLLPDSLYYYRQNPDSTTRGGNINKLKKSLESAIRVHRFINIYLKRMPDIEVDKSMVKKIHVFFTETFWTYLFFNLAKGLNENDVIEMSDGVFKDIIPEDSEFVGYLFKRFFLSKN